jgi:hypothetical protein
MMLQRKKLKRELKLKQGIQLGKINKKEDAVEILFIK